MGEIPQTSDFTVQDALLLSDFLFSFEVGPSLFAFFCIIEIKISVNVSKNNI